MATHATAAMKEGPDGRSPYRLGNDINVDAWLRLYHSSGWNEDWTTRNAETMLGHAHLIITAWLGDELLVGTLTVLGDGLNYATIDDVVVHPAHRGNGIGSRLTRLAMEEVGHLGPHLEAIPGVASFYAAVGFVVNHGHTAMYWPGRNSSGDERHEDEADGRATRVQ